MKQKQLSRSSKANSNGGSEITEKSRVCVKNLPKYLTLNRFKAHFSQIGELTDAMLLRTKDGTSRRMGFLGYRTEQQAEEAIKYFNKSYIDCCRIVCEVGWKSADPNIPRPWSWYSKEKEYSVEKNILVSGIDAKIERKTNNNINESYDPKLQEFLQVMRPCSKRKFWANDLESPMCKQACTAREKPAQLNQQVWNKSIEIDKSAQKEGGMHHENPTKSQKMACDSSVTDMDYFKSRIRKDWSDSESDTDENGINLSQGNDCPVRGIIQEQQDIHGNFDLKKQECMLKGGLHDGSINFGNQSFHLEDADKMLQTSRIYVWNLPYAATEDEVEEFFNKFGKVKDVHLVIDKETKQPRGFGYVHYNSPEEAARVLGDHIFQGRVLHVVPAENARGLNNLENHVPEGKGKTYKQHKEEKRKALEASGDTRAWNTLFMRADTIVENLAWKYGVSKSDLLDREADDVAVRIALGETSIIAETKKALTKAGVNVVSLEEFAARKSEGANRSNHVLLVKNLPFSSSKDELSEMFGRFGSLDNVIFPPTRTLALVIFVEPAEARAAFNCLRYKRYRDSILYLEWAPSNILCQDLMPSDDSNNDVSVKNREAKEVLLKQQQPEEMNQVEIDSDGAELRTLYVKNLHFGTTDEKLGKYFRENANEGKVLSARVVKHLEGGKYVSSGYGFVEFDSSKTANNVLRELQGTILDGHMLKLQLSQPKKDTKALEKVEKGQSSTKLIVRNLPFEATKKELRQLFSPFGQVKSLRLPKNYGGAEHRGFGFVEYSTKQEAREVLKALSRIHFYGRPMVTERANEDETLGELRARIAAQYADDSEKITKKRKIM
ncbi:multiple RNA-binding domain-containing protein 1-like [Chenopodium quinoa]|uniref:multiple RNA-binding domain-containing protein 1-like n=1 Tax=Chenopodium quinoa TaxID=63459 RepID=UPI000B788882|nr:multiple RNA-binding domain-containing protein 1-like [Chenopodium quinoa]